MNRIAAFTAAALLAAPAAFAEQRTVAGEATNIVVEDEGWSMMHQRLQNALADCQATLEEDDLMNLTLAQVSGIIIESNSGEMNQDKCQRVEALIQD